MRVCYVVQRYGMQIAGGAEQHCREMAERLAQRGHEVEVATTCAQSYVDWANEYPAGTSELNGVTVHRFPVVRPRDNPLFSEYNRRVTMGRGARPRYLQEEWMRMQGPWAPELPRWLLRSRERFDAVICFTYLYWTTWAALDTMAGMVPLILHPTVHDEPPLRLSLYDQMFRRPDTFALSTPEEVELIRRRFHVDPAGDVIGIGVELPEALDPAPFLEQYGLRDTPYLLYLGRLDEGKGAGQLMKFFVEYKRRHPRDDLKLVMCGEALIDVPERDDIIATGFVDYENARPRARRHVRVSRCRRSSRAFRWCSPRRSRTAGPRSCRAGRRCCAGTRSGAAPPSRTTAMPSSRSRSRPCVTILRSPTRWAPPAAPTSSANTRGTS